MACLRIRGGEEGRQLDDGCMVELERQRLGRVGIERNKTGYSSTRSPELYSWAWHWMGDRRLERRYDYVPGTYVRTNNK